MAEQDLKIGGVRLNLSHFQEGETYSDGDVEEQLLNIVMTHSHYEEVLKDNSDWAILYHLHPMRENLLSWYNFTGREYALEIGAGCGALTGLLAQNCKKVICSELSLRRSKINAYKNAEFDNVEIMVGNFSDVIFEQKFDLITMIGVLEYSASYIQSTNPYDYFLKKVRSLLKPEGKLIVAIENRFGLKYWAGCREDHTGRLFEGLEGYPNEKGICTFSRRKLELLLKEAGFANTSFYYPMPDYKLPLAVYSDERLPLEGELVGAAPNYDMERLITFSEERVYNQLIREGMFPFFANSFLTVSSL